MMDRINGPARMDTADYTPVSRSTRSFISISQGLMKSNFPKNYCTKTAVFLSLTDAKLGARCDNKVQSR